MTRFLLRSVVVASALVGIVRAANAGELRGRFLLGERPAAGVTVSAVPYEAPLDEARREARRLPAPKPIASVTAGADGSYVLVVPAGQGKAALFTVRVEGGGAVAASIGGSWDASETADLGDHVLLPGGKLAGRVTDAAGVPVADAEVVLVPQLDPVEEPELDAAPRRAQTAADGTFHFDDASATGNMLTVEKRGLLAARQTGVRAGSLRAPIVLGSGAPLSGFVRKSDGTSPAAGTLVRVEGRVVTRWVEAGEDGSFTIPNAPAGPVTAVADGGEAGYLDQHGVRLPLAQGKALALILQPASALVGRTVDARTGRPVPRTRIALRGGGESRTTRSGPDGAYALRGLPPRSWQVRADESRYVAWTHADVPVRPGETKKLDIPLVLGATLAGRVADEGGKPVAGAKGSVTQANTTPLQRMVRRIRGGEPFAFRTAADGTFKATRLAPGESQLLVVSHPDFEPVTLGGISLLPGATKAGVAVVLKRGGIVAGVVKDGNGQPVTGAEAELAWASAFPGMGGGPRRGAPAVGPMGGPSPGERKADTTGGDGTFSICGVAPGEYALTVKRSGYATERVEPVKVPPTGSPTPLLVTLSPGAVISGRVVRRSGMGAEGFVVAVASAGRPRFGGGTATDQPTGPDGAFSLDGLRAGQSYDLQLRGPTGWGEGKRGVVAPASNVDITVAGLGRITGTALDAQDSHPITDFQVSYEADRGGGGFRGVMRNTGRGAGGASGGAGQPVDVHSADGTFALEDVPAGTWSVVVTAAGYQPARTGGVTVEEGGTRESVEVRVAKGALMKGHVTDATSGAPVANATASIAPVGSSPGRGPMAEAADSGVTTDADGHFEIEGVATGKQSLRVTHPDYTDATQIVQVTDESATVEVRMTQGGVVAGVVASETGQPVQGASVALSQAGGGGFSFGTLAGGQQNVTDGAGRFRFDHLGAGRYAVTASLGSHTSAPAEVVLLAGQSQEALTLQLILGITIQGMVSGLPATMVNGMTVSASGTDSYFQSTRLGADGGFEFDNVPTGVVTLRGTATDPSGSTRSVTKQVTASADQPVLTTELVFDQGFTLSGRVTQAGQPVAGTTVFAALQGGGGRLASAVTDGGGSYQLNGLQEGTYTVNAMSVVAGASKRQTITLTSDQSFDIAFPSGKINGQVLDANGNMPLAGATVTMAAQDPGATGFVGQRPATTDSNGQFSFSGLDEGTYTLSTSKPDFQLDKRDVTAIDEGTAGLIIALKRGAGIGIKVMDGLSGVPLPGVMVRVFDPQGAPVFGPSSIALDGDGQGEIPSLPPGTYTVIAAASGYAAVRLDGVNVPSSGVAISLTPGGTVLIQAGPKTLAVGTATGTIATAAGQPALLSLFNLQGRVAISEPNLQLSNVAPGNYLLTLPAVEVSQAFVVNEGAPTVVKIP